MSKVFKEQNSCTFLTNQCHHRCAHGHGSSKTGNGRLCTKYAKQPVTIYINKKCRSVLRYVGPVRMIKETTITQTTRYPKTIPMKWIPVATKHTIETITATLATTTATVLVHPVLQALITHLVRSHQHNQIGQHVHFIPLKVVMHQNMAIVLNRLKTAQRNVPRLPQHFILIVVILIHKTIQLHYNNNNNNNNNNKEVVTVVHINDKGGEVNKEEIKEPGKKKNRNLKECMINQQHRGLGPKKILLKRQLLILQQKSTKEKEERLNKNTTKTTTTTTKRKRTKKIGDQHSNGHQ